MQSNSETPAQPTGKGFIARLMHKWQIDSPVQVVLILVAFSLAGSSAVFLRKAFFGLIGISEASPMALRVVAYILFLFPAYQVLLLAYGTLLGQFRFFWAKEVAMVRGIGRGLKRLTR